MRLTATAAAAKAVELVRQGQAELLMKGSLHTDELLGAVVARETGLRTGRRISHVFIMDIPTYHKVLIVTDAAINIAPTLEDKVDICQNAIDLAMSLGVSTPKVAILAAVETVNSKMPATIDAAALCKMAERGQITGGLLDGPLAFDNAISREAARVKGITSKVAGDPDILLVPDLEAGNMLAKQLSFLANADSAGLVLGARVPIILTSRADSVRSKIASCAVAVLTAHARRISCQPTALSRQPAVWELKLKTRSIMDDYALVLNAGSSSLKFCVYGRPRGPKPGVLKRAARSKASGPSPRFSAKDGAGRGSTRSHRTTRCAMRRTRARFSRRLAALPVRRRARARRRAPRRAWRGEVCRSDDRDAAGPGGAPRSWCRWLRCISRTTSRRLKRWRSGFPACRRSPASTPAFIADRPPSPK